MLGNYLFTAFFELARDGRPRVIRFDELAPRISQRLALDGVAKQAGDRVREVVRRVGREKVAA
jgi:hypothetical protein